MAERDSGAHHAGADDTGLWEAFGVAFGGDRRTNVHLICVVSGKDRAGNFSSLEFSSKKELLISVIFCIELEIY